MNKIELIKAEIERREKIIRNSANQISDSEKKTYYSGCADALLELLPFINSLQQEQPSDDLEKAAESAVNDWLAYGDGKYANLFIAGAHWGVRWDRKQMRLQAEKALAKTDVTLADMVAFDKGVAEGRRMEREEMKKDVWKPGEEQMKALIDCTIGNEYDVHALVRLFAELKKL